MDLLYGTTHGFYGLADVFGMRNHHSPRPDLFIKAPGDLTVAVEGLGYWRVETADILYPESAEDGGSRLVLPPGRFPFHC